MFCFGNFLVVCEFNSCSPGSSQDPIVCIHQLWPSMVQPSLEGWVRPFIRCHFISTASSGLVTVFSDKIGQLNLVIILAILLLVFHRFWFSFLTTVGCRHFPSTASLSMIRTRPVYLESRVPLVNREPRADLDEYLGPGGAPHVDLIAIEANPDILVPFPTL